MTEKKKAMISQPMNGLSDDEIKATNGDAKKYLTDRGYEVVNTFFEGCFASDKGMDEAGVINLPVCLLARSVEKMSMCHSVYFCKGWEKARGCVIEHEIAEKYGLEIIYQE